MTTSTDANTLGHLLVDTSAWIALMNREDQLHVRAVQFKETLSSATRFLTTWDVVGETYTWIRYHVGSGPAQRWLAVKDNMVREGELTLVYPNTADTRETENILRRFVDQDLSFADAFTLATVRTHPEVDALFAFDHHLHLAGIPVVP